MKNSMFLGALTLTISQICASSASAGAVRILQEIPACQEFAAVKSVKETDQNAAHSMNSAGAALKNISTFDKTCAKIAGDSSYNSDIEINKLVADSKMASKTAMAAVKDLDVAAKKAEPIMESLGAIGARDKCVEEAKSLPSKLLAKKKEVEIAMKKAESCVNRASASAPTQSSTMNPAKQKYEEKSAPPSQKINPADHSHEESSCVDSNGNPVPDCADRGDLF